MLLKLKMTQDLGHSWVTTDGVSNHNPVLELDGMEPHMMEFLVVIKDEVQYHSVHAQHQAF